MIRGYGTPLALIVILSALGVGRADAQSRFLEIHYTPAKRAQVAIWIESADGVFLRTILLTEAVGLRGIGNRPGALQMNSGFRWPYGRREGVLPIWAHRRAAAPAAAQFPRVVFQNRIEGYASRLANDQSRDLYFCLASSNSRNDDVDATSCASIFNSDKGRFLTQAMVDDGYSEPYLARPGTFSTTRALGLTSLYPMRRDLLRREGYDSPDVTAFADADRAVLPEIDVVTRATAAAGAAQHVGFGVPDEWPDDDYVIYVEVNTEADFSEDWSIADRPTPPFQVGAWDIFAASYGFPYRGQPSVLYRLPIRLDGIPMRATASRPEGYGEIEGLDGSVRPLDGSIVDDPTHAPGSGADRLRLQDGVRVSAAVRECSGHPVVAPVSELLAAPYPDETHAHELVALRFIAAGEPVLGYRVKVSSAPIRDETDFERAEDAKAASVDYQGLDLCPVDADTGAPRCPDAGALVEVTVGKLDFETRYFVAVRALGPCGAVSPIMTSEVTTSAIHFTTVAPCFVATAAFGSPMARDVGTLRRFRDARLLGSPLGRGLVHTYYEVGPTLADVVRAHPALRSVARALLRPFVQLARLATRSVSTSPPRGD